MQVKTLTGAEKLKAAARLIRLPNLLIIILIQYLLRYCILVPFIYSGSPFAISTFTDFSLLVLVTVLIATGGYVINDYFDIKIDLINRPDKLAVNRIISPRGTIKLHMILNTIAILIGFYLAYRVRSFSFGIIFPFISGLLWIYSAKYKRVLIWGNIIVAVLSAFVILIVWLFEFFWSRTNPDFFVTIIPDLQWVTRVFLAYSLFAFLVSFFREIIKDMEDWGGDEPNDCRTLPVVTGLRFSKFVVAALIIFTIVLLGYGQILLFRMELKLLFWYFSIAVQLPALYLFIALFKAREKTDYHLLSLLSKLIMIAGILSLEVILITT
ncbi:MAG: geranylgeranylglycerol-phosphate geranylgeranyltransferase [Bacteroidales bacterium]|jgi:4-hydroxybenzoate polyprenyltransferase|nr:geranylgeranylglycerol-phosphate geranylgeranyltransferase [Bacteroidales bacterium]